MPPLCKQQQWETLCANITACSGVFQLKDASYCDTTLFALVIAAPPPRYACFPQQQPPKAIYSNPPPPPGLLAYLQTLVQFATSSPSSESKHTCAQPPLVQLVSHTERTSIFNASPYMQPTQGSSIRKCTGHSYSNPCCAVHCQITIHGKKMHEKVEMPGIDPGTSRMLSERSTI